MPWEVIKWLHVLYNSTHDLAIAVYIGGAVSMEFVLGPAQKSIPPAQAQVMGQKTADRFLWLVWGSLGLIIVSGLLRLQRMGFIVRDWPLFRPPVAWDNSYGRTLFAMFLIWCVLVINGALITFVFRPRLSGKLKAGASSAQTASNLQAKQDAANWVQRLTRIDLGLALVAAVLGASLKVGGVL